jgi:nucleoid-associated protein YgaU
VEVPAQLRGLPSPHLPALGWQQQAASTLVASAALLFTVPLTSLASPALGTNTPSRTVAVATISAAASVTATTHTTTDRNTGPMAEPTSAAEPSAPSYQVKPGDSLWLIAEHALGDGARFHEIAQLNYGRPQPDGLALTDDHWLRPGWILALPEGAHFKASVPESPRAAVPHERAATGVPPHSTTVTVQPGDTLWDIAQDQLGDGARYGEIAAASHGMQPDGAQLRDPDLIRPGWHLTIPRPAPEDSSSSALAPGPVTVPPAVELPPAGPVAAPALRPHHDPDVTTPPLQSRPAAGAVQSPAGPSAAARPVQPRATAQADGDRGSVGDRLVVRTAEGVGGLLAAGLLLLLGAKRARQQRRRRPGERIAMPTAALAVVERDLRLVEDPDGLARVDQALRTLSVLLGRSGQTLPALRMARLTSQQLELYLDEPGSLPTPFQEGADATVWTVASDAELLSLTELTDVPAPYPSLVTIGHDPDGAHLLLDLEHVRALSICGDIVRGTEILAAIAAEYATSSWAPDLHVTIVGCLPELPDALGTGRVRHLPTLEELLPAWEHRATDIRAALQVHGFGDLNQARTAQPGQCGGSDAWTPEIVLVRGPIDPDVRARLDAILDLTPGVGVSAVITDDTTAGPWTLTLDDAKSGPDAVATLLPLGVAVRPQRLAAAELDTLLELFAVTDLPARAPSLNDAYAGHGSNAPVDDEPALADLDSQRGTREPEPSDPARRVIDLDTERPPDSERIAGQATATAEEGEILGPPDDHDDAGAEAATEDRASPLIQLLGPVDILNARGTIEPSKRRQLLEIAAYLSLHPGGDRNLLNEAIWPGAPALDNTRHTALSKLRKWLGTNDDGVDYVPRVLIDGYRMHPHVRSDWQQWQELLPDGPAQANNTTLRSALALVKGKPFAGTNPRHYAWAEPTRQDMISAIADTAHELARRSLLEGDATGARQAAAAGLYADPGAELLWRDALKAEWLAGDRAGLEATADRLTALSEDLGDDLEPETIDLLNELLDRPARKVAVR